MTNLIVMPAQPWREVPGGSLPRMGCFRAIALGSACLWLRAMPVMGQQPQQVITDTPEYCLHLFDRVSELVRGAATPPPQEVTFLSTEGQRMCDQGQTRGGILRLRRALLLMMQQSEGR